MLLSSLADGELDAVQVKQLTDAWSEDAGLREDWHLYHLIGDCLRSDELAASANHDLQFMTSFRARLQQEPVVFAPVAAEVVASMPELAESLRQVSTPKPRRSNWSWGMPAAVAAGFMLVAGGVVMFMGNSLVPGSGTGPVLAQSGHPGPNLASGLGEPNAPRRAVLLAGAANESASAAVPNLQEPQTYLANGALIRDAQLDRYLAAHKQFGGSAGWAGSSEFLRNATVEAPKR